MLFKLLTAAFYAATTLCLGVQAAESVADHDRGEEFFTISNLPKNETRETLMHELNYFAKVNSQAYCLFTEDWSDDRAGCPLRCDDNDFKNLDLFDVWRPVERLSAGTVTLFYLDHARKAKIILFRGSTSINDWIVDFTTLPVGYTPVVVRNGAVKESDAYENTAVHLGFYEAMRQTWVGVNKTFTAMDVIHPEYKTIVIGHSLGGAVAQLVGLEFSYLGYNPSVITWGSPRVGDVKFAEMYDKRFNPQTTYEKLQEGELTGSIRQVHNEDVVTLVPPAPIFKHAGVRIFLDNGITVPSEEDIVICNPNGDCSDFPTISISDLSSIKDTLKSLIPNRGQNTNIMETIMSSHTFYYIHQMECVFRNGNINSVLDTIKGLLSTILDVPFTIRGEDES